MCRQKDGFMHGNLGTSQGRRPVLITEDVWTQIWGRVFQQYYHNKEEVNLISIHGSKYFQSNVRFYIYLSNILNVWFKCNVLFKLIPHLWQYKVFYLLDLLCLVHTALKQTIQNYPSSMIFIVVTTLKLKIFIGSMPISSLSIYSTRDNSLVMDFTIRLRFVLWKVIFYFNIL